MTAHSLSSRLVRWEEARRQGVELSPEELCPDAPELAARLRDGIAWLRRLDEAGCAESGTMSRLPPLPGSIYGALATPLPAAEGAPIPVVPGYDIEGEIGRGGMGVVYKARQVSLNRPVALKMILAGAYASESELARFRREAEALARLRHPNIVTIHDIGEHDGRPYFSLELCEGGSLERRLAEGPLPPREAAALVEVLARAVDAAHRASLVHRDLKPSNVLLAGDGTPKVTDFGLAKRLDQAGQTQTGEVMGTPSYMAPEQARGSKDVGAAADVYALGAILYECLTGRPPFKAATTYDTILQVIAEEPVAPSALNAQVPRDVETIALKCLQKAPAGRYGSARELADDLRRWLGGEAIVARPVGVVERARKWVRRRPAVSGLLSLVAALVAGGVVTITALYGDAVRQAGIAQRERDAAREAEGRAEAARARAEERTAMSRYAFQLAEVRRELAADNVERAVEIYEQCPEGLRGWEHAHLGMRIAERAREVAKRPVSPTVESVAFSPDGRRLAGGSRGRMVT